MRTVFPSTIKVTLSPFDTPSTSRTSFGIVICPFAITLALSTHAFIDMILHHLTGTWKVGISLLLLYAEQVKKSTELLDFLLSRIQKKAPKYNNAQIESLNISKNAIFTNPLFFLIIYTRYEIDFIKID